VERLFLQVIEMNLTSCYVILFVILARLLLKKAPKVFSYALWSVVLFRLVCPFSFESMFSLIPAGFNAAGMQTVPQGITYLQTPQVQNGTAVMGLVSPAAANSPLPAPAACAGADLLQNWIVWGTVIWLAGIVILFAYSVFTTFKLYHQLKSAKPVFDNVYALQGLKTPFVFGAIQPKIYLPAGLTEKEKSYIIKHEQIHIRRFDHLIKPFAFLVLCIHWFNPLVWVAFFLMSGDMELSCDEGVIKQLGSGIKKDYSTSLLSFSAGRQTVRGYPLAFGENNAKGRITNILHYKKPAFWVVAAAVIAVVAVGLGLLTNPLQEEPTVEDYARQFIAEKIKTYESMDWRVQKIKIIDSKITKLEKMAAFENLLARPVEIWEFEYRLRPDKYIDVMPMGVPTEDGWITETADDLGKPMLIFANAGSRPEFLGYIYWGAFADFSTPAAQEIALREFLEGKGLLPPETYPGAHIIVKFPLSSGETYQLFLSQPVVQGEHGIWCVERWGGDGNLYYVLPDAESLAADYYRELQNEVEQGHHPGLKDPLQVAVSFIKNDLGQWQVARDDLVLHYAATVEDFLEMPESHYIGFISNFKDGDKPYFHLDQIEWLTLDDTRRLAELNIDPDKDMPNGFYIHNPHQDSKYCEVTGQTKYYIINWVGDAAHKSVAKEEFIKHLAQYQDFMPPFRIVTKGGFVQSIREQYVP
jgi:beta-lactamase regulating signal transducer with metallopeptidase domain